MNSLEDTSKLLEAVERTNRLLCLLATRGMKQTEAITLLDKAGLSPTNIAEYIGTTRNTVNVALHKQRNRKKQK